jgi:cold shock protein
MMGTITRVVTDKGFGFITGEDGQDYFFHRSAFDRELDPMVQGLRVTFDVSRGPKGLRAENVRVVL